jgi:hypothetical protein
MMGAQLERTEQQTKRDKEENERREREKAAYKALADLAESIVGPGVSPAPQLSLEATQAARGINPPSTRGTGALGFSGILPGVPTQPQQQPPAAPGVEINPVMGSQPPEARPLDEQSLVVPDMRSVIARSGVRGPAAAAAAAELPGPKTSDDRLGFALWRQPALFNDPRFAQGAAQIFLKAGMPEGVKWLERGARAQQENALTALRSLLQGDPQGAEEAFNSTGRVKIEPGSLKQLEDGRWQVTVAGTGQTRTFDPRQMYRSFLSPREFLEFERRERADVATAAHRDRTAAETERHHRATETIQARNADLKLEIARIRSERGPDAATALQRNLGHLVKIGVAKTEAEAFGKLRTSLGKPEEDAILDLTKNLMGRPAYYGKDGAKKAEADAREIVRSIRGGSAAPAASPFKSDQDVKAAFRAGRINRAQAERVLREQFGYQ